MGRDQREELSEPRLLKHGSGEIAVGNGIGKLRSRPLKSDLPHSLALDTKSTVLKANWNEGDDQGKAFGAAGGRGFPWRGGLGCHLIRGREGGSWRAGGSYLPSRIL